MLRSDQLVKYGYDVTSSYISVQHAYLVAQEDVEVVRLGDFMVQDPRANRRVRRGTGAPGELFAGIVLALSDQHPRFVTLGCGFLQIMTIRYDGKADWTLTNDCLVVLGPGGTVTATHYQGEHHQAIGRVWALPEPDYPALGVSVMAWG